MLTSLHVSSESFQDGQTLPPAQRGGKIRAGGKDESPQLSWSGAPAGTRSYAVTVFDPDAPGPRRLLALGRAGPSGGRHLAAGRGGRRGRRQLPPGAFQLRNDGGFHGYLGAAPPRATARTATSSRSTPWTWSSRGSTPAPPRPSWKPSSPRTPWPGEPDRNLRTALGGPRPASPDSHGFAGPPRASPYSHCRSSTPGDVRDPRRRAGASRRPRRCRRDRRRPAARQRRLAVCGW